MVDMQQMTPTGPSNIYQVFGDALFDFANTHFIAAGQPLKVLQCPQITSEL